QHRTESVGCSRRAVRDVLTEKIGRKRGTVNHPYRRTSTLLEASDAGRRQLYLIGRKSIRSVGPKDETQCCRCRGRDGRIVFAIARPADAEDPIFRQIGELVVSRAVVGRSVTAAAGREEVGSRGHRARFGGLLLRGVLFERSGSLLLRWCGAAGS
ncbi:MAG: hypothetical protein ACK56I_17335, partial [bacterium]